MKLRRGEEWHPVSKESHETHSACDSHKLSDTCAHTCPVSCGLSQTCCCVRELCTWNVKQRVLDSSLNITFLLSVTFISFNFKIWDFLPWLSPCPLSDRHIPVKLPVALQQSPPAYSLLTHDPTCGWLMSNTVIIAWMIVESLSNVCSKTSTKREVLISRLRQASNK